MVDAFCDVDSKALIKVKKVEILQFQKITAAHVYIEGEVEKS